MNTYVRLIIWLLPFMVCTAFPSKVPAHVNASEKPACCREIDLLLQDAINSGLIAGGVVLVGDSRHVLIRRAYGKLSGSPDARLVEVDSLFDVASLTKVIATAPAVLKLVEEERISLADSVCRWFPEFSGKGKDDILVKHLLTHTSGIRDGGLTALDSLQRIIKRSSALEVKEKAGTRFHYADINFILLGELVRRVTGVPLDSFAREHLFVPLHMHDTVFNPQLPMLTRCAATLSRDNESLVGRVQDPTAFVLGGVAGHAGLFSTVEDLAVFCRMMLNKGSLEGNRVLTEKSVAQMTGPCFFSDGKILRGLGWDIQSPFSSPRGKAFSGFSFGHTGFTGCSVWIDPATDVFVVFLTSRLEYTRKKDFNRLRGDLSDAAVSAVHERRKKYDFAWKFE
jgi:CubicO group peptidase (beta-lactamase class C family)